MDRRDFIRSMLVSAAAPLVTAPRTALGQLAGATNSTPLLLEYTRAASRWVEALPIGNGRLGAMVFGDVNVERLQLNEDTLWSGKPRDRSTPGAQAALADVRKAVLDGRYVDADAASKRLMGPFTESYLPLGDLFLTFEHGNVAGDYRRQLDLASATVTVHYRVGSVRYTREVIASHPDQVIAIRLSADKPGMIRVAARVTSPLRYQTVREGRIRRLMGEAPSHVSPSYWGGDEPVVYDGSGMRFEAHLTAVATGGEVRTDHDGLYIQKADEAVLLLAAATSFSGFDQPPAPGRSAGATASAALSRAAGRSWVDLHTAHVTDHRALFDRVSLDLGSSASPEGTPTDQRVVAGGGKDPQLVSLLFQYGRYLLIACSRSGSQPANLQGIWNEEVRAPWSANYTININTEMNYWPAEPTNLAELHEPLLAFVGELAIEGAKTAQSSYGARGWVAHHNSDLWRQTEMVGDYGKGDPVWATWPMSGPWLSQHLYEHYLFGGDRDYLRDQGLPGDEGRRRILSRLADRRRARASGDGTVDLAGTQVPDGRWCAGRGVVVDLDGHGPYPRSLHERHGCRGRPRNGSGVPRPATRGPEPPASLPHRLERPAARMVRGVRRSRARASPFLASVRPASGAAHLMANPGADVGGPAVPRDAGRRWHWLEFGLEGQSLGAAARR